MHNVTMSRFFLTLAIASVVFALPQSQSQAVCPLCRVDEVCSECAGICQKTCENPNPSCSDICAPGCACKDGYLRDKNGKCIPAKCCKPKCDKSSSEECGKSSSEECDKSTSECNDCPKNEVLSECGGLCQKSCENPNPICPDICRPGCVCEKDYLRNKNGECIPSECCKSKGGESGECDKSKSSDEPKSSKESDKSP